MEPALIDPLSSPGGAPATTLDRDARLLGAPLTAFQKELNAIDNSPEQQLENLVNRERFNSAAALSANLLQNPQAIQNVNRVKYLRIVVLLNVKQYASAEHELDAIMTGLLGVTEKYTTRAEPPTQALTGIPSVLFLDFLLLHATSPGYASKHNESLERLYSLLHALDHDSLAHHLMIDKASEIYKHFRSRIMLAITNELISSGELQLAIVQIQSMLDPNGDASMKSVSPSGLETNMIRTLLSLLGRVYAQMGNASAAEDASGQLECLVPDSLNDPDCLISRGYLNVIQGDYEAAQLEFEAALSVNPADAVAANNRAVCLLYLCRLNDAIASIENFIRGDPRARLHVPLLTNLAVLYQMKENGVASRQCLDRIIAGIGPDTMNRLQP